MNHTEPDHSDHNTEHSCCGTKQKKSVQAAQSPIQQPDHQAAQLLSRQDHHHGVQPNKHSCCGGHSKATTENHTGSEKERSAIDPVCGMTVSTTSQWHTDYQHQP